MIRIKDIKLPVETYGPNYEFDWFLFLLMYPAFGASELQCHVNKKLGPLPDWNGRLRINRNKEGIITSVTNGPAEISRGYDNDYLYYYFQSLGYRVEDKEIDEAYQSWFAEKGFPDPAENPEGFVLKLVELYPQLSPFIEII